MCECWCRPALVYGFKVSTEDVRALARGNHPEQQIRGDPAAVLSAVMERLLTMHRGISVHHLFLGDRTVATSSDDGETRSVRVRSCVVGVRALSDSINCMELRYEEDRALKEGVRVIADVLAMRLEQQPFALRWHVGLSE